MKIKPTFTALLTYSPAKDGVKTTPVSSGYRSLIKFPFDLELYIGVQTFGETDLVFPGDTISAEIALLKSEYVTGKIYEGLDFDFFEGENLIGHGVVTKVIHPDDIAYTEE
jgi:translation elongation factor EF-Tu-like GTPase